MELELIEIARAGGKDNPLMLNATLLMQVLNFAILLILLRIFVWKPLMNVLERRQQKISEEITNAEKNRKEAEEIRNQLKADLEKAKEEARAIIQRATKTAEEEATQIVENAKAEASRVKEDAMKEIQIERDKAIAELKNEVANLSILVASKVVSEKITEDIHKDLVKKFVDEAGKLPC